MITKSQIFRLSTDNVSVRPAPMFKTDILTPIFRTGSRIAKLLIFKNVKIRFFCWVQVSLCNLLSGFNPIRCASSISHKCRITKFSNENGNQSFLIEKCPKSGWWSSGYPILKDPVYMYTVRFVQLIWGYTRVKI